MIPITNTPDVSTPHPHFRELEQKRELPRTLLGGTFAMRKAGTKYLPKHPAESDNVYQTRLQKTFLDNFLDLAITKATGKLFSTEPILENIPDSIDELLDNIDLQGSGLDEFLRHIGRDAFVDGIAYVLLDTPKTDGVATLADQRAKGLRPYAVHIKTCHILEILSEMVNGIETVTRVRFRECIQEPSGEWGFEEIHQIRVLTLNDTGVVWQIWRENDKHEWTLYDEGLTGFRRIYLIPFYTNRCGFMTGEPGFSNIAESNLEHWQTKSEHAFSLSMCCFGMFTATGVDSDFSFEVGAAKCQISTNPDAKFSVLETSGTGVNLASEALKAIESRIETAGVQLRVENAGKVTATAAAIDSEETNAGLNAISESFGDSLETLLDGLAEIMSIDAPDMCAYLNIKSGVSPGTPQGLQELTKAVTANILSKDAYLSELVRRGELPEDFDIEANSELLNSQTVNMESVAPIAPTSRPKISRITKNADGSMTITNDTQMMEG